MKELESCGLGQADLRVQVGREGMFEEMMGETVKGLNSHVQEHNTKRGREGPDASVPNRCMPQTKVDLKQREQKRPRGTAGSRHHPGTLQGSWMHRCPLGLLLRTRIWSSVPPGWASRVQICRAVGART